MKNNKIDFVITWVDGSDKKWIESKNKYSEVLTKEKFKNSENDSRSIRYRDMDCLKYWFRGVEKYAPWVNKIYFVTCGQIPKWLNIQNDKIVLVNHEDFIPKEYLPTFSSIAIELFIHKIPGLSENFVYFNDDMFIVNKTTKEDFFKNELPCDIMCLSPILVVPEDGFHKSIFNNVEIINKHFSFVESYKKNKMKYLSFKQGKYWFRNVPLLNYKRFVGFKDFHLPISYLKSTFYKVWELETDVLNKTASFKFRNNRDSVMHWLFQYWQFAEGNYYPRNNSTFGKSLFFDDKKIYNYINKSKYKTLCINDRTGVDDYEAIKQKLIYSFENKFPEKSSFEK